MSSEFKPIVGAPLGSMQKEPGATTEKSPMAPAPDLSGHNAQLRASKTAIETPAKISALTTPNQKPEATYKCPKCGTDARDIARFCPRCHATLRFECPSCGNRQRAGGKCEKCGIDFIKYIGAVVAGKKAEADAIHDRLESRSSFLKAVLLLPFNGGVSLIRHFFKSDRD